MSFAREAPNRPRDAALGYAETGFTPVPLKPGSKKPSGGVGWQAKAGRNPRSIKSRFRAEANVGLLMGRVDDRGRMLFAVDVDRKHGADLKTLVGGREWPETPTDATPSGVQHAVLWGPPGMVIGSLTNAFGRGYDLIGSGNHIVVEPSTVEEHPGIPYLWIKHPTAYPVQQAPDWLADLILESQGPAKSHPPDRKDRRDIGPAVPGAATPVAAVAKQGASSTATGDRTLLDRIISKFPLTGTVPAEHNRAMTRMGPLVIFGTTSDDEAHSVYEGWWPHYHGLGACGPVVASRIRSRVAYLLRSAASGKITPPKGQLANREDVESAALGPDQIRACESLTLKIHNGGWRGNVGHLQAMIRTIVISSIQSRISNGPGAVQGTVVGWRKILEERFGLVLHPEQFNRLKVMLVRKSPRPGIPAKEARVFELLRETKEGWHCMTTEGFRRYPSEFEASDWLEAVLALGHRRIGDVEGAMASAPEGAEAVDARDDRLPGPVLGIPAFGPAGTTPEAEGPDEAKGETETADEDSMDVNVRAGLRLVREDLDIRRFRPEPGSSPILMTLRMLLDSGKITLPELEGFVRSASTWERGVGS